MRQETYRDAVVSAKYKLLTAMAISIALRCEPCIRAYVQMAYEKGITREELIEFLEVAMTMQGCPGEEWALKAYAMYKDCVSGNQSATEMTCCAHEPPASRALHQVRRAFRSPAVSLYPGRRRSHDDQVI